MEKLKAIKILVCILTFLLVFGTLTILGVFAKKNIFQNKSENIQSILNQPAGSYIKDIKVEDKKIYILVVGGGKEDRIIVYNTKTSSIDTTIALTQEQ